MLFDATVYRTALVTDYDRSWRIMTDSEKLLQRMAMDDKHQGAPPARPCGVRLRRAPQVGVLYHHPLQKPFIICRNLP